MGKKKKKPGENLWVCFRIRHRESWQERVNNNLHRLADEKVVKETIRTDARRHKEGFNEQVEKRAVIDPLKTATQGKQHQRSAYANEQF